MLPASSKKVGCSFVGSRRNSESKIHDETKVSHDLSPSNYEDLIKTKPTPKPRTVNFEEKWSIVKLVRSDVQLANATWRRVTVKFLNDMIPPDHILFPNLRVKEKIESKLTIEVLRELGHNFHLSKKNSYLEISAEEFKAVLKKLIGEFVSENEIELLFMKIDFDAIGSITLNQLCTYVHLIYHDFFPKCVSFSLPARKENLPHRESVCRICENHSGSLITCSEQGIIAFWSPKSHLRKKKRIVNSNCERRAPKWITDFLIMSKYNKLLLGTGSKSWKF